MKTLSLKAKALTLVERREAKSGVWFYWRQIIAKQVLIFVGVLAALAGCWLIEFYEPAYFVIGVWVGRVTNDIRWIWKVSAEWETLAQLVDWPKVESLVGPKGDSQTPVT